MFYRRKILLSFIENAGGKIEKIRLQKLLFIFCQEQEKPAYNFVPHRYGCYSFTSEYDLEYLVAQQQISKSKKHWHLLQKQNYASNLKKSDRILLESVLSRFAEFSTKELIQYTYKKYPFYASRSKILDKIIKDKTFSHARTDKTVVYTLFTIGYEGLSIEAYLNKLIQNDVKVLIDVRNNPFSMKWGFSKSELATYCKKVDIRYMHFPEVGIPSHKRKHLSTQQDYNMLFEEYKSEVLSYTCSQQKEILNIIEKHKKVAITCFEADVCQCHRKHLAEQLQSISPFKINLEHI